MAALGATKSQGSNGTRMCPRGVGPWVGGACVPHGMGVINGEGMHVARGSASAGLKGY